MNKHVAIIIAVVLAVFLPGVSPSRVLAATTQATWWDNSYKCRQQISINTFNAALPANTDVRLSINTSDLETASMVRADRKDWRVVYFNSGSSTWTEIPRNYAGVSETWFQTQASVAAGSTDNNYYVYYCKATEATSPATYDIKHGLYFNLANSNYVDMGNPAILNVDTNDFTVETTFKTTGSTATQTLVNKGLDSDGDGPGWAVFLNIDGTLRVGVNPNSGTGSYIGANLTTASLNDGVLHHVTVVFDRSGNATAYVDGVAALSADISPASGSLNSSSNLNVGRFTPNGGMSVRYFTGFIDEVRIWNQTRSVGEIQSDYNSELNGTETGLIGYWKFNDASGTTANDSTSNNNDGTLQPTGFEPLWSTDNSSLVLHTVLDSTQNEAVRGYFNGWSPSTSQYKIGTATSSDGGLSFTHSGSNPILSATGGWEGTGVHSPFTIYYKGLYMMYFTGGWNTSGNPQIGLATSTDGVNFTRYSGNPVVVHGAGWDATSLVFPFVYVDETAADPAKKFAIFFSGGNAVDFFSAAGSIGLAYSPDGFTWTEYGSNPIVSGEVGQWDEAGLADMGTVIKLGANYRMYYVAHVGSYQVVGYATASALEGPWTKGSALDIRRGSASQVLTSDTNSGSRIVQVGDTSVFAANEPVFLSNGGANLQFTRVASIDSSTQLTIADDATRNYQVSNGAFIRSWLYGSNSLTSYLYDGTNWQGWAVGHAAITGQLWEMMAHLTGSDGIVWTKDYVNSPPLPLGTAPSWNDQSCENLRIVNTPPRAPTILTGSADSGTAITWSWTDNSAFEDNYLIDDNSNVPKATASASTSSKQETSLTPNTLYFRHAVGDRAANFNNVLGTTYYSQPSNEYLIRTLANLPAAPTVSTPTQTSLRVILNVNANPADVAMAIFESTGSKYVQADGTLGDTAVWQTYSTWGGASGIVVTGLTAGTTYTFKAKARNADNVETTLSTGTDGTTSSAPTPTPSPSPATSNNTQSTEDHSTSTAIAEVPKCHANTPVGRPWIVAGHALNATQIQLNFTNVASPIDHFSLTYGVESGHYIYGAENIGNKNSSSYVVNALTPGRTYFFKINGVNGCAPGEWSNEVAVKTMNPIAALSKPFAQLENDLSTVLPRNDTSISPAKVLGSSTTEPANFKTNLKQGDDQQPPKSPIPFIVIKISLVISALVLSLVVLIIILRRMTSKPSSL